MNRVPKSPLKLWVRQKIGRVCVHGVLYVGHINGNLEIQRLYRS